MNVEIDSKEFAQTFSNHLHEIMSRCMAISRVKYESKNRWANKLMNWFAFRLIRVFSFILTVFSYHRLFRRYFLSQ
jgi:hypothetical protein